MCHVFPFLLATNLLLIEEARLLLSNLCEPRLPRVFEFDAFACVKSYLCRWSQTRREAEGGAPGGQIPRTDESCSDESRL